MAKILLRPLQELPVGQLADFFVMLSEKSAGKTRDGKPFFTCKFKNLRKSVSCPIWADSPQYETCESQWQVGQFFKIRGIYSESEKYGPQISIDAIRPIEDKDRADGFQPSDFYECSRFEPEAMFETLTGIVQNEIADEPLRLLVLKLLHDHQVTLQQLPASERRFFPFPGGWLEHVLSVTRTVILLVAHYQSQYPEQQPPLNRDLVIAGSVLHDIGRVAEFALPETPGQPVEQTVPGRLFGHLFLGRDLIREAARDIPELHPQLLQLLEHIVISHLALPKWGSPRLPAIPEVLILHHADDLDAKMEYYLRHLRLDDSPGPLTQRDPNFGRPLLKNREV